MGENCLMLMYSLLQKGLFLSDAFVAGSIHVCSSLSAPLPHIKLSWAERRDR